MTKKRNLLLVSLFLIFGLATVAPSALAQLVLDVSLNTNVSGRAEGLAEATGWTCLYALPSTSAGTLGSGSSFDILYTTPVTGIGTVLVQCGGPPSYVPCTSVGPATLAKTNVTNDTVHIPITSDIHISGQSYLFCFAVRVNANHVGPGKVTSTVNAAFVGGSSGNKLVNSGSLYTAMRIQQAPALTVGYGSEGGAQEGVVTIPACKGAPAPGAHFAVNVAENFPDALTSEKYEKLLDAGGGHGDVTNGSIITLSIDNVPHGLTVEAEKPVPCTATNSTPSYCPGGTLAVNTSGATVFHGPGTATFKYVVTSVDNQTIENTNLPFKISSTNPPSKFSVRATDLPPMGVTVSISPVEQTGQRTTYIPQFVRFAENATPLTVVKFTGCP